MWDWTEALGKRVLVVGGVTMVVALVLGGVWPVWALVLALVPVAIML